MKLNNFRYYFRQATRSIRKNHLMSFASIGTTVATLFFLGVILVLTVNINSMAEQFSRSCELQVFVDESLDKEAYENIGEKIKNIAHVSEVEKYTKEQIFEEMRVKLGDKAVILEGLEKDNPFRDSYKINLDDLSNTKSVTDAIKKINGVANITDFQEAAGIVVKVVSIIRNVSFWLVLILCIVAAFIVSNTIKVSVFSRRKEINIMKYIGATDWFVRWPFIIEGMILGAISAVLSFLVVWVIYIRLYAGFNFQLFKLVPYNDMAVLVLCAFLIVGIVIGSIGSAISIRKHLKV